MRFPDEALGCRTDLGRSGLRPVRCQVVSDVAALPAAQPEPLGAASRYGCRRGLRPWQFSLTSQSDVNAAPSDETSRPARRVSPGHRFKDGLRPRAAALWRPLYGESVGTSLRLVLGPSACARPTRRGYAEPDVDTSPPKAPNRLRTEIRKP